MKTKRLISVFFALLGLAAAVAGRDLDISANRRFFSRPDGTPFFWQGDTAWLLFRKATREDALFYLDTRKEQGFNVAQVMLLHDLKNTANAYGDEAIVGSDVSRPVVTNGRNFADAKQYDYWDHIDWIVNEAAKRGIFVAMVPIWGSNVKAGIVDVAQARAYAKFLARRFRNRPNIVWLNGGDLRGDDRMEIWKTIGETLRRYDKNHLITFHPRGRTMSSEWFHDEAWLDFNMFQSGHRNYAQDNDPKEKHRFGEDNWRYAEIDFARKPVKPTLDGEPSYENIPQGLHDPKMPRWKDHEIRRYAYWSVFAGGAGVTYGENSVMQFHRAGGPNAAYGAEMDWRESIRSPGANQMRFLRQLMLSRPYFERIPSPEIVADQGEKYRYIAATRGVNYAFLYVYTGRQFKIRMGFLRGPKVGAAWFDPRTGAVREVGMIENSGEKTFDPPGDETAGNDWVLILDAAQK